MTREYAIECLNYQNEKFFGGQSEALKMAISALSENKGKWIFNGDNGSYECSKCRYLVFYSLDKSNFCPDCGADLRGEEDEG